LLADADKPAFRVLAGRLADRLRDYDGPAMPSGQRVFLMGRLRRLAPGTPAFAAQSAEELAGQYLEVPQPQPELLRWTKAKPADADLWHVAAAKGRIVAIARHGRLVEELGAACRLDAAFPGAKAELVAPDAAEPTFAAFLTAPAANALPGWTLQVRLVGDDPFSAAADRQKAAYAWTAGLGVTTILAFALIVAGYVGRQVKLARLKNDLIATVSHELKTPLASMRVLVDTLLDGRCRDDQQAHEYYRLIARENERLSRLIENFLTFSRMERNKVAFDFAEVRVEEAIATAAQAVRERFSRPGCRLEVEVAPDLPPVRADRDALVTVLLNLLDNAYKYTGDDKQVSVRATAFGGSVRLEVRDNGIGISRRAMRRIFDRFYQADQRLSRGAGGCGLGLSIVRFIVEAHGGAIDVTSRPGEGSTFTVSLPCAAARVAGPPSP
jgi:signal transduction histidine kinase